MEYDLFPEEIEKEPVEPGNPFPFDETPYPLAQA